jgi:hypothetical protein
MLLGLQICLINIGYEQFVYKLAEVARETARVIAVYTSPNIRRGSIQTERHGRVVSAPDSYSGVPGSNLGLETGYPD